MKAKHFVLLGTIVTSLLLSACAGKGNIATSTTGTTPPKVATFDYKRVAAAHPLEKVIKQEAAMLQDFRDRKVEQVQIARNSFASIRNLQYMQQLSKLGYLDADMQTRMAEARNVEKEMLTFNQSKWLKAANARIADRKQAIESEYQLELFNLRVQLENARLRPSEQEAINKKITQKKKEREDRLADLFKERDAYIKEQAGPYMERLGARLAEKNSQLMARNSKEAKDIEKQYDDRMQEAPQALARAMQLLDAEIGRLERRQLELSDQVGKDVLEVAKKVAKDHSCELSLTSKENSLDITDEVLHAVKLTK